MKQLLSFTTCLFFTAIINGQGDTIVPKTLVDNAVLNFVNLVDSQDVHEFGVTSIAELKSLKPGRQFKKYVIGLNDLKKFKHGDDPEKIIKPYDNSVEVGLVNSLGQIRTSIDFVKVNGKWKASAYGLSPELAVLRQEQATIAKKIINKGRLIRVPALQVSFITIDSAGHVKFLPLGAPPKYKFIKGEKIISEVALLKLVPAATKQKDLPH